MCRLCIILFLFFFGCVQNQAEKQAPLARKGIIDLGTWNFDTGGPVKLSGEWDFYFMKFVSPEDFLRGAAPQPDTAMKVLYFWNNVALHGKPLPADGYATYRLRIQGIQKRELLALELKEAAAYRLYINGTLRCAVGSPGKTRAESDARYSKTIVTLSPDQITAPMDIVIHISNFHFRWGGIYNNIELGTFGQIHRRYLKNIISDFFLFGSILIMGLYHLALFCLRRKDRSPLFFGLVCIFIAVRTIMIHHAHDTGCFRSIACLLTNSRERWCGSWSLAGRV